MNLFELVHRRDLQLSHANRTIRRAAQAWANKTVDKKSSGQVQLTLSLTDFLELEQRLGTLRRDR